MKMCKKTGQHNSKRDDHGPAPREYNQDQIHQNEINSGKNLAIIINLAPVRQRSRFSSLLVVMVRVTHIGVRHEKKRPCGIVNYVLLVGLIMF